MAPEKSGNVDYRVLQAHQVDAYVTSVYSNTELLFQVL